MYVYGRALHFLPPRSNLHSIHFIYLFIHFNTVFILTVTTHFHFFLLCLSSYAQCFFMYTLLLCINSSPLLDSPHPTEVAPKIWDVHTYSLIWFPLLLCNLAVEELTHCLDTNCIHLFLLHSALVKYRINAK